MRNALIVFAIAFVIYGLTVMPDGGFNEQTRSAVAFLHGRLDIPTDSWIEAAARQGKSFPVNRIDVPYDTWVRNFQSDPKGYALHPPLVAVMLVPFVAIGRLAIGEEALVYRRSFQPWCSVLFGAIDVTLTWVLLARLGVTREAQIWLTLFFGLGTILWTETIWGTTWNIEAPAYVMWELLILIELFGNCRPWLVGILAGLGFLAYPPLLFVIPVYAWMVYKRGHWPFGMLPGLLGAAALYVGYNELRYATITDQGMWLEPTIGPFTQPIRPIFGLRYLAGNLETIFVMGPRVDNIFPYVHPSWAGQAIVFTSPVFLMALRAPWGRAWPMWLAAALAGSAMLLCFVNGEAQFGTRHWVDMFPFLLVLVAMEKVDQMTKFLICVSIVLVGWGALCLHQNWIAYS